MTIRNITVLIKTFILLFSIVFIIAEINKYNSNTVRNRQHRRQQTFFTGIIFLSLLAYFFTCH